MFHMPSPDGSTSWRLPGANGWPLQTQQTGWLIDIRISSPYVATGQQHKVRKVTNAGSYVPETKNVVISEQYTLKTSNSREGILKMVSEFSPAGIIGAGKEQTSTILLGVILGDPPNDFVEVLPGFKLKWTSAHAQKELGAFIRVRERPLVLFTLGRWGSGMKLSTAF